MMRAIMNSWSSSGIECILRINGSVFGHLIYMYGKDKAVLSAYRQVFAPYMVHFAIRTAKTRDICSWGYTLL